MMVHASTAGAHESAHPARACNGAVEDLTVEDAP